MIVGKCEYCNVTFNHEQQRKDHEASRKHQNKVKAATNEATDVLNTAAGIANQHIQSQPLTQPAQPVPQVMPNPMPPYFSYSTPPPQAAAPPIVQYYIPQNPTVPVVPFASAAYSVPMHQPFPYQQSPMQCPPHAPSFVPVSQPPQPLPTQPMNKNEIHVNIGLGSGAVKDTGGSSEVTKAPGETQSCYCHVSPNNYQQHIKSKKHLRKATPEPPSKQEPSPSPLPTVNPPSQKAAYFCNTCQCGCNSKVSWEEHCKSTGHIRKMGGGNVNSEYKRCDVCDVPCSSEGNWQQHIEGRPHKKNVAKQESEQQSVPQQSCSGDTTTASSGSSPNRGNDRERAFFELQSKIINIVDNGHIQKFKDVIHLSSFMKYSKRNCDKDEDCIAVLKHLKEVETFNQKNVKDLLHVALAHSHPGPDGSWWHDIVLALREYLR